MDVFVNGLVVFLIILLSILAILGVALVVLYIKTTRELRATAHHAEEAMSRSMKVVAKSSLHASSAAVGLVAKRLMGHVTAKKQRRKGESEHE